jgi:hypothetical protein
VRTFHSQFQLLLYRTSKLPQQHNNIMKITLLTFASISSTAYAFTPSMKSSIMQKPVHSSVEADNEIYDNEMMQSVEYKPILRDPLGLYPSNALERQERRFVPLEPPITSQDKLVTDPLNIYGKSSQVSNNPDRSMSLPFLKRPEALDGSLPGDRGFDPFNFSSDQDALQWQRTAEIKHGRLAMLAAAGWPIAELFDRKIAYALELKPLLVFQDRVPSILNGGLSHISPAYWFTVFSFAAVMEAMGYAKEFEAKQAGQEYTPGDLGFDPLGLSGKTEKDRKFKLEAELFNGRLGMLAITGFAIQEWWTQNSVINETPVFFKPINVVLEHLQDAAGHMMM